MNGYSYCRFRK